MIILGDVHGDIGICRRTCGNFPDEDIVQLGDFGIGFFDEEEQKSAKGLPANFNFFCGNHDDRVAAKEYPSYLGDFGIYKDIFFVCGADSIDKNYRVEGLSWWRYEELNAGECNQVLNLWQKSTSTTLITHDCSQFFVEKYFSIKDKSTTRNLLDEMYKIRKPRLHIFGHHHRSITVEHNGTTLKCLNINELAMI